MVVVEVTMVVGLLLLGVGMGGGGCHDWMWLFVSARCSKSLDIRFICSSFACETELYVSKSFWTSTDSPLLLLLLLSFCVVSKITLISIAYINKVCSSYHVARHWLLWLPRGAWYLALNLLGIPCCRDTDWLHPALHWICYHMHGFARPFLIVYAAIVEFDPVTG